MAKVMMNFRSVDWIYDCILYTRQLSPVFFDEGGITITLLFTVGKRKLSDLQNGVGNLVIDRAITEKNTTDDIESEACVSHFHHSLCENTPSPAAIESPYLPRHMTLCIVPARKCEVLMNAHLASCVSSELRRSRTFRRRFLKYLGHKYGFFTHDEDYEKMDFSELLGLEFLSIIYMVDVTVIWPKQRIDFPWNFKLQCLIEKRKVLEEVMAYLSTLGGAYSSLGDYFQSHALLAGALSKHQLQIALQLADPIVAAKCKIFWALSLLQQGHLKESKRVVRCQYEFATSSVVHDQPLLNMCLAVWSRLQYVYKMRKIQRLAHHSQPGV